jgi:hypothetical protein
MSKDIIVLLILLLSINIIETENVQAESMPESLATGASNAISSSENNGFKILGIDSITFPEIKINLLIDKSCAMAGNLKKENFKVQENGNDATINDFYFTGKATDQMLDLAIVFDDTGSMGQEISVMKSKVEDLTDTLKVSGIDAVYSLVSFRDNLSVNTEWTNDSKVFKKQINSLRAKSGDDEPEFSLDAIEAVLSMGFRPDAQKVILVITDAHAHYRDDGSKVQSKYTKEEIEKDLKASGAIFILVSSTFDKPSTYVDLKGIANDTPNIWIDINSVDFSTILEKFQGIPTGTYAIEYTSPDQTPSENRAALVSVNVPGCVDGSASSSYITPGSALIESDSSAIINETALSAPIIATQTTGAHAESWNKTFGSKLDDLGEDVTQTSDGGYIITGQTNSSGYGTGTGDVWLIKTNAIGEKMWDKTFGGEGEDKGKSIQQTKDGGYIIAGYTDSFGAGKRDAWIIKTDSLGQILWEKTFGGPNNDAAYSVQATNDGDLIIAGSTESFGAGKAGASDVWIIKTDSSGNNLWDKTFEVTYRTKHQLAVAESIQETSDMGYIITGKTSGYSDIENLLVIKTDAEGNEVWKKLFTYENGTHTGYSVYETKDKGYFVAGVLTPNVWLIKMDSSGNKLWEKFFRKGEWAAPPSAAYSAEECIDGGHIIVGEGSEDLDDHILLIKIDSSGNMQWERTFGGRVSESGRSVRQTNDGGYIIVGYTTSFGAGYMDVWLIKTEANGNV